MNKAAVAVLVLTLVGLGSPAAGVITFPSGNLTLHGVIYMPPGEGPFPAVLYNHGSAPGMYSQEAFDAIGPLFVKHGWVFFAPWRRGQGLSANSGPYIEAQIRDVWRKKGVTAAAGTMIRLLETDHLNDQLAGLAWLKKQSFIDQRRIAVMGNSLGGIETVLGAEREPYCAAIDASGGAESWAQAAELRSVMIRAASSSKAPMFFFQAANDYDLAPSRILAQAMREHGKTAQVKIYPPFGSTLSDGHSFAYNGSSIWVNDVFAFLKKNCGTR